MFLKGEWLGIFRVFIVYSFVVVVWFFYILWGVLVFLFFR